MATPIDTAPMEVNYAGRIETRALSKKERNDFIREHFDIPSLRKLGFFRHERTFDQMEQRILTFFGMKDIREYVQLDESCNGHITDGSATGLYVNRGRIMQ